jgi:hypothetical protein
MKKSNDKIKGSLLSLSRLNLFLNFPSTNQLAARLIDETLIMNSEVDNPITSRNMDAR